MAAAEQATGLTLTSQQRMAVRVLLQQRVGLLQGGAGTGKTTSMRVFVAACKIMGRRVEPAALSGKAALKLAQASQLDALTIAQVIERLNLRDDLEAEGRLRADDDYRRDEHGVPVKRLPRLTSDTTLLLDEASMVDISSLYRLLERLPDGAGLVLAGDVSQLPPVGVGQVYHNLVAARHGVVELTQILRQADGNPLLDVAAAVRSGKVPALPKFAGTAIGVQLHECTLKDVADRLGEVRRRFVRDAPLDDLLVLSARKTTVASVCRGEMTRRQADGAEGVRLGPLCAWISVGDPVMMSANYYGYGLANGQLGRVTSIDPVRIQWDGSDQSFHVEEDYRADVVSAWAITCHKSQGSEACRVLIGLDSQRMLTRQWLYTAVTRAREQAVLVGPFDLLELAVKQLSARTTLLSRLCR